MTTEIPQISFGGGVIAPEIYARVDLNKFGSALASASNFFVLAEGGISNRAGLKYIKSAKDSTKIHRLIPFEFNEEQAYALEFSEYCMRVYQNGGVVVESTKTITGITQANPAVVTTSASHSYSNGDEVYIASVVGMTEVNAKFFTVANVTSTTFELSGIDSTSYTAYSSAGTSARVFELTTPYDDSDLATLKFRQSNDVMYMTHRSYAPRKLSRTGAAAWTLEEIDFEPTQDHPSGISVTVNTTGSETDSYKVTAVARETAEESLTGLNTTSQAITGATQADPVVLTVTAHPFADGDEIEVNSVAGMTELNGRRFVVANQATNTIELTDLEGTNVDGTGYTAYSSGGTCNQAFVTVTNSAVTVDNTISWTAVSGAESYNIYKEDNGLYGFIGSTEDVSFTDDNIEPDLDDTAPKLRQPFESSSDYPGAVGLHEQRSVWGNTTDNPLSAYLSQTSEFENMNVSSPTRAGDAVTVRLITGQGNEIRHFRSFQERLFIFTSGALWSMRPGGDADAITPTSKQLQVEEYISCTDTPPITIQRNILMVSGKANQGFDVRSLGYMLETDAYTGNDLTILARHLLRDNTIVEWAYSERPFRLLAVVRDDGDLLIMTYMEEQKIFAWTVWETDGDFKSVVSIPEGQNDVFYFVVERTIGGNTVKMIEQLHTRSFTNIEDAFFVDSGLTLDETDLQTITGATQADPVVVTITGHPYEDGDKVYIESVAGMTEINNREFTVANKTANTFELTGEDGSSHTAYTSGGTAQKRVSTVSGLDHLEGESVIVLNDGNIEAAKTVSSGSITLTNPGSVIQVGLSYTGSLESLPLDLAAQTIQRKKVVKQVSLRVHETRGLFVGPDASNLEEYPSRSTELWGDPAATLTDLIRIPISDDWTRQASVVVQSEPGLPMTILSMIPELDVGE